MPNIMHIHSYFKPMGIEKNPVPYIWHKLNLPTFLFSVGLLTLMYIDPLIVLAMLVRTENARKVN